MVTSLLVHRFYTQRAQAKLVSVNLGEDYKFKQFKNGQRRPQYSYFRYGLDFIRESILQIFSKFKQFMECLALINPDKIKIISEL